MAKLIIPVCLLLLAIVHTGYALKCYACDSKVKSDCADPFAKDKIPLNECPSGSNEASCLKITTEENNEMKVKRYCLMYPKGSQPCDYAKSQMKNSMVKLCESCVEDGCNAAGSISASTYAIFATCLFAVANMYQRA